jgi:hypothetical protein
VNAGVFAVMPNDPKHLHMKSEALSPARSYLLEEQITNEFKKYIHNGSALPNLEPNDSEYHISLFLCACQHVQYTKTHKLAYVSDFQGANGLLTDAQIMTSL